MATSSNLPFAQLTDTERADPSTIMLEVARYDHEAPSAAVQAASNWRFVPRRVRTFELLRRVALENPEVLRYDDRTSDPEVMAELVAGNPALLRFAATDLMESVEFATRMIEHKPANLVSMPFHESIKANPELALEAMRQAESREPIFSRLPKKLLDDVAFCRQAQDLFDSGAITLSSCGPNVLDDRQIVLDVLSRNPADYARISERLRNDREIFMITTGLDAADDLDEDAKTYLRGHVYPHMGPVLADDEAFIDEMMRHDVQIFRYASPRLRGDLQRTALAVRKAPELEDFGAVETTDNAEDVLVAIATRGPSAFRRASPSLLQREDFLVRAVQSGIGFTHLGEAGENPALWPHRVARIQAYPGAMYQRDPEPITNEQDVLRAPAAFRNDAQSMGALIPTFGIKIVGSDLMDDRDFVAQAMNRATPVLSLDSIMGHASKRLRGDAQLGQLYFDRGGRNLELIAEPLSNDKEFVRQFIERDLRMLAHVGDALRDDLSYIREVVLPAARSTQIAQMPGNNLLSLRLGRLLKPLAEMQNGRQTTPVQTFMALESSRKKSMALVETWAGDQALHYADDLPVHQREVYLNKLKDAILSSHPGKTLTEAKFRQLVDLDALRTQAEQVKGWRVAAASSTSDLLWPTFLASQRKMAIDPVMLNVLGIDPNTLRNEEVLTDGHEPTWSELAREMRGVRKPPVVKTPKTEQEYHARCLRMVKMARLLENAGLVDDVWSARNPEALLDPVQCIKTMPDAWLQRAGEAMTFAGLRPCGLEAVNPYRGFQLAAYEAVCTEFQVDPFSDDPESQAVRFAAANVANFFGRDMLKIKRFVADHPANARRKIDSEDLIEKVQTLARGLRDDEEMFEEFKSDMDMNGFALPDERSYGQIYSELYETLRKAAMIKVDPDARPDDVDDEDRHDYVLQSLPDIPFETMVPALTEIIEQSLRNQFQGRIPLQSNKSPSLQLHDAGQFDLPVNDGNWNKTEWIAFVAKNPECSKFIGSFAAFEQEFHRVATGTQDLRRGIKMIAYGSVAADEESIARLAADLSLSQGRYKQLLQHSKNPKSHAMLPEFHLEGRHNLEGYSLHLMAVGDPRALVIGEMTSCCQKIGGAGEASAIHSFEEPSSGVYYVENARGEMVAQAFSWISKDEKSIIYDSIESRYSDPKNVHAVQALFTDLSVRLRERGFETIVSSTSYGMTRQVRQSMGLVDTQATKTVPAIYKPCGYLDCRPGSAGYSMSKLVDMQTLWPTSMVQSMAKDGMDRVRPAAWNPSKEELVASKNNLPEDFSAQVYCRKEGETARVLVQAFSKSGECLAYDERTIDLSSKPPATMWSQGKPGKDVVEQGFAMVKNRLALPPSEKSRLVRALNKVAQRAATAKADQSTLDDLTGDLARKLFDPKEDTVKALAELAKKADPQASPARIEAMIGRVADRAMQGAAPASDEQVVQEHAANQQQGATI